MTTKNALKAFLAFVYIALIAMLIFQRCNRDEPVVEENDENDIEAIEAAEDIGGDGEIKITLLWQFYGDVDLHVTQPNGTELSFREMTDSRTGGRLDVDNRDGGRGSAENIYWTRPLKGTYRVNVVMYRMDPRSRNGGQVRVVVKNGPETRTYNVRLSYEGQDVLVAEFYYDPNRTAPVAEADTVAV